MQHELKTWPEHFRAIEKGAKTCELRLNDRNYQTGDTLYLREWEPLENSYTGASVHCLVTHILSGGVWISPGYIAMSIRVLATNPTRDFICEECGRPTPFRANGMCINCITKDFYHA